MIVGPFYSFLTGSYIIICDTITVTFTNVYGTTIRPIVHTCVTKVICVCSTKTICIKICLLYQAPVVRKVDNAIHWITHYPVDSVVCFASTYPLDSDLYGG